MSQSDLLKNWKSRATAQASPGFPRKPEDARAVAGSGQKRLFLLQQLYPGNPFYQHVQRYWLTGPLDENLLGDCFRWTVDRHELLRSTFSREEDEVFLTVHPPGDFDVARIYADDYAVGESLSAGLSAVDQRTLRDYIHTPFDLEEDYLVRALLVRHGPEDHELYIGMHHIIGDRGSLQLLEQEIFGRYTKLAGGATDEAPPLPVQYADFTHREATRSVPAEHEEYWRNHLAGELPTALLPADSERPQPATFNGAVLHDQLGPARTALVRELARRHRTTPNVVFLAALNVFLYRVSGSEDVLVGSPVSTRDHKDLEGLIGFFNETVVLRNTVVPGTSFDDFVGLVRDGFEAATARKNVSFEWLIRELNPERRGGVHPFFQTMFVYNAVAEGPPLPPGLTMTSEMVDLDTAKFDLTLFATDTPAGFSLDFEYAYDLLGEETAIALFAFFRGLLNNLLTDPDRDIATVPFATDNDARDHYLGALNPTFPPPEGDEAPPLLTDLFLRHAAATPMAPAVSDGNKTLTYADVLGRSDALAHSLLRSGLAAGTAVGLLCGRTPNLLVGILGILRAGGVYVPLDPEYPRERIDYIVADAGATIIVHDPGLALPAGHAATGIPVPQTTSGDPLKDGLPTVKRGQNAYLIYTSGSTGKPKGIAITHDNLAWSTEARFKLYDHHPGAFLLLSSFAFDSSVAGIFWSLASGGKLVLSARRAEQDPAGLGHLIQKEEVTHTLMLPSLYQLLLEFADTDSLASLRIVMVAGEACPPVLTRTHFNVVPEVQLFNEYGPTEGTVWSTAHHIRHPYPESVPIGRPVYGMGHYVLDKNGQLLPHRLPGELYLSGRQLAAGYHGRPELTAERFLPNPFAAGERMYRTGDVVVYDDLRGHLLFRGRTDEQVKIRGHRIEMSEISKVLDGLDGVRESVVVVVKQGEEPRLAAYVAAEDGVENGLTGELTAALRERLPAYMIPDVLVTLADLPRLPNGKVDRKSLPDPAFGKVASTGGYEAPQGETEEQLAKLWAKILKLDRVGRHDNFFEIGGDSLKSIRIIAGAKKLGLEMAPHHLFNHQTVTELAVAVAPKNLPRTGGPAPKTDYEAAVLLRKGGPRPPLFCLHSGGGHVFFYRALAEALDGSRPVYAIQPRGLAGEGDLPNSMPEMAADYIAAMKEIQPGGPYLLLGSCFSNALAVEMATQLRAAGDELLPLLIIDSGTGTFLRPDDDLDTGSKLGNLVRMVRTGRWDKIARRLRVRGILGFREVVSQLDEQRRNLYGTIGQLNDIYAAYEWPPYPGEVILIRSSEFANRRDKDHHVTRWRALAGSVSVHETDGEHLTLFEPPAVAGLAQTIDRCLR